MKMPLWITVITAIGLILLVITILFLKPEIIRILKRLKSPKERKEEIKEEVEEIKETIEEMGRPLLFFPLKILSAFKKFFDRLLKKH